MGTAYNDVAHLLRRAAFGGNANEISALAQLELPAVVEHVLDTSRAPALGLPASVTDTSIESWRRGQSYHQWWSDRMAFTAPIDSALVEKMVLFWHMHFTSHLEQSNAGAMIDQLQLFRTLGLGNFAPLAQAVAVSPAMLGYLDNRVNVKGKPNENWARESMELFTLGVNAYTQEDVAAVAKAWTGHSVNTTNDRAWTYQFNATKHDTTNKTIFGITKNWDGPDVMAEICSGSKKAVTARFIAKKLWEFFAYPDPASSLLDSLQATFVAGDLNIKTLLRAMFLRSEFYSAAAKQGRVRNPVEFIAAAQKYTGLDAAENAHPEWYADGLGLRPWYPPNVSGWGSNERFISTSVSWQKGNFTRNLTWKAANAGVLNGTSTLSVATAVQRAFDQFGINEPSASSRAALEQMVIAERTVRGWAENVNLLTATMLTPEFQLA